MVRWLWPRTWLAVLFSETKRTHVAVRPNDDQVISTMSLLDTARRAPGAPPHSPGPPRLARSPGRPADCCVGGRQGADRFRKQVSPGERLDGKGERCDVGG